MDPIDINQIQTDLSVHNLMVNADKTEFTILTRNDEWKRTKKVSFLIGDL